MKVVIVGHGPGLKGAGRGWAIDACDAVVRFVDSFYFEAGDVENYGIKTDYILSCDQRINDLHILAGKGINLRPKETWVYGRPQFRDEKFILQRIARYNPCICKETDRWEIWFKAMGATGYSSKRCADPHFSSGMAAIIMTAEKLKPAVIHLPGFEAVLSGDSEGYDSGTNRGHILKAEHDFATEKRLLDEVKVHYGFEVDSWI
jgi:hypothetical protein